MTAQNGIPWWYFFKHPGPLEGRRLQSLDPSGAIDRHIAVDRVVGSIVYFAAEVVGPGVIRRVEGNRISIGELDGVRTARAHEICTALEHSGFKTFLLDDIRSELWIKLWGNSSLNPISALCRASMKDICQYPLTRQLVMDVMMEIQSLGNALGIQFRVPLAKRLAGAEAVGHHKTSMLQDIENGRSTEAEALLGSLIEIGRIVDRATPRLETLYSLIKLLDLTLEKDRLP
jgi:2-dehydropantoate 2-reductase